MRSGDVSLDTDCRILSKDCWSNFQVEEAISTLKIQEGVLLNYNESPGWAG
jgi:hypothetical protein